MVITSCPIDGLSHKIISPTSQITFCSKNFHFLLCFDCYHIFRENTFTFFCVVTEISIVITCFGISLKPIYPEHLVFIIKISNGYYLMSFCGVITQHYFSHQPNYLLYFCKYFYFLLLSHPIPFIIAPRCYSFLINDLHSAASYLKTQLKGKSPFI